MQDVTTELDAGVGPLHVCNTESDVGHCTFYCAFRFSFF
jgi:hypothetical protein